MRRISVYCYGYSASWITRTIGTVGEIRQSEVKENVHLWQVITFILQFRYGARYCSHRIWDNYHVNIGKMRLLYSYHVNLNFLGFLQSYSQCHEESQGFAVWGRQGGGCPVNEVRGEDFMYFV